MSVYNAALAPRRPTQGLDGHSTRRVQLEHVALAHVFEKWDERTAEPVDLHWAGSILRKSKIYLAAVVVDHPQLDKFTGSGGTLYV